MIEYISCHLVIAMILFTGNMRVNNTAIKVLARLLDHRIKSDSVTTFPFPLYNKIVNYRTMVILQHYESKGVKIVKGT